VAGIPLLAIGYWLKILWTPLDLNPGPPPFGSALAMAAQPARHALVLITYMVFNIFELV
jgi:hypothetical protein